MIIGHHSVDYVLMSAFEYARLNLDELLVLAKDSFEDHLENLK